MADENLPVTKKDFDSLRDWLAERMDAQEARLQKSMEEQESRLLERMEAQETRLLTAFHRFAEANHARIYKVEAGQRIDGDRLTKLEERVLALEESWISQASHSGSS